jgi:hypothetical protein
VSSQGTNVALNGSASHDPDGDPLTFGWTTDCPGGGFDNPTSATPSLTVDSIAPCSLSCTATLTVSDLDGASAPYAATVTVEDTVPPLLTVDTTPITVTDVDCSGDEVVTLPTATAVDQCDALPAVSHNAPATFPASQTTPVTYTATDDCGNLSGANLAVTVFHGADIAISANKHTVGIGSHPGSTKDPLAGIGVCGYDKSEGSCARTTCGGISHQHYECIASGDDTNGPCTPVNCCTTDANGECTLNLPPGAYIVISADATKTTLPDPLGVSASDLLCGELKQKHLQQIVKADGKKVPGKTLRRTGSELLVIEPEFIEWTGLQEFYPFVFESVGDWEVTTSVSPPKGFVTDYDSLSEQVVNEAEAVQFTITDFGSDWVPTEGKHTVSHRGRRQVILSRVGVRLASDLAQQKGLGRYGHVLDADVNPRPMAAFDPRAPRPCEIVGWREPSVVDPGWTVKLRVDVSTDLTLQITRGQGLVVQTLASGNFTPGDYEFTWDGGSLGRGRYFVTLVSGHMVQRVPLVAE